MCRKYGGMWVPAYVRLCYRCGERRGEHMPLAEAEALGWRPGGHVPVANAKRKRKPVKRRPLEFVDKPTTCPKCGRVFIGRDEWCPICQEEFKRQRMPLRERLEAEWKEKKWKGESET